MCGWFEISYQKLYYLVYKVISVFKTKDNLILDRKHIVNVLKLCSDQLSCIIIQECWSTYRSKQKNILKLRLYKIVQIILILFVKPVEKYPCKSACSEYIYIYIHSMLIFMHHS